MDRNKTKRFIYRLCDEQGITIDDFENKYGVINQMLLGLEKGLSISETGIIEQICNDFGVTYIELICGERMDKQTQYRKLKDALKSNNYSNHINIQLFMSKKSMIFVLIIICLLTSVMVYSFAKQKEHDSILDEQHIKKCCGTVSFYQQYDDNSDDIIVYINQGIRIDRFLVTAYTTMSDEIRSLIREKQLNVPLDITAIYTLREIQKAYDNQTEPIYTAIDISYWNNE